MTRAGLIAELAASSPHLRQADCELIVATIFDQITAALARGDRVERRLQGEAAQRRIGRNPHTQEMVQVDEKAVPHFKTGTEMLRRLNRGSRPASERPTQPQPLHRPQWQRLPANDSPGAFPRLGVICDAGKRRRSSTSAANSP